MAEKTFKIGLLGLGMMGQQHTKSIATLPGVEVVTRKDAPFNTMPVGPGPGYQTALCERMIADPTIDAIDICLPTALHAPLSIAALDAGKHVICEKPMALTAADCVTMLRASERAFQKNRGIFMVAQVLRFWPAYCFLREAVACRTYGAIRSASLSRQSGEPTWAPWLLRPEESGTAILDMLVHDFDHALLLFGPPESARARTVGTPHFLESTLRYKDGLEVAIGGGWLPGEVPFGMKFGLTSSGGDLRYGSGRLELEQPPAAPTEITLGTGDAYALQLAYFIDCCRNGRPPADCLPASSAQAVELAIAVRTLAGSAEGEGPIRLQVQ